MVFQQGIEVNPKQVRAIIDMQPPRNTKEVQWLVGRVMVLSRFIFWVTGKCFPFFRLLEKTFDWNEECDKTFQELKVHLSRSLLINQPKQGEVLYVYLSVSETIGSSVLIREEKGVQMPVYHTSRAFRGAKERYPRAEKMVFTLIVMARWLRPYFQLHII